MIRYIRNGGSMWPEPLQENGIYCYKGMTIKLQDGKLWEMFSSGKRIEWLEMGNKENYCILIDELATTHKKTA